MPKIIIEFDSLEEAREALDDVHQLFMRRNPLDEPIIELIEDGSPKEAKPRTDT